MNKTTLNDFLRLKEQAEKDRDEHNRLAGIRDGLLIRLQKEFGCDSVKEVKQEVAKLKKEVDSTERVIETKMLDVMKTYKENNRD